MSNSTPTYDPVVTSQAGKETTVNAYFDAASPATAFGRRASACSGLTWGYYGGTFSVDGVLTQIANGTLTLTASTTNYVEANRSGVVSKNTTGFTAGSIALYTVVTGSTTVTSYIDYRTVVPPPCGHLALTMSDANTSLTIAQARCDILELSGTLTAARTIWLPLAVKQWTVFNNTSGGFGLQFIGATGTGITVAAGKRAIIYSDGTNVVRVTADS